jgi:FolB domain-containing protein
MDKVLIEDLSARGIIGINDWERKKKQEILINLTLFGDQRAAAKSDDIRDCINYRTITKKVLHHAETAERFTVEALAADIADICLEDEQVLGVQVRVEKPGAVRFARSVGVEIERMRDVRANK